jgi:hypothetical protein
MMVALDVLVALHATVTAAFLATASTAAFHATATLLAMAAFHIEENIVVENSMAYIAACMFV